MLAVEWAERRFAEQSAVAEFPVAERNLPGPATLTSELLRLAAEQAEEIAVAATTVAEQAERFVAAVVVAERAVLFAAAPAVVAAAGRNAVVETPRGQVFAGLAVERRATVPVQSALAGPALQNAPELEADSCRLVARNCDLAGNSRVSVTGSCDHKKELNRNVNSFENSLVSCIPRPQQ